MTIARQRVALPFDVVDLGVLDTADAELVIDLLDADGAVVAHNLHGNLLQGSGDPVLRRFSIPLQAWPHACAIRLQRMYGQILMPNDQAHRR